MQTILGANGVIANNLASHLPQYTKKIRLVSRHPRKVNEYDELFNCDLLDAKQTSNAIKGSEIVYLTAGIPYRIDKWRTQWPIIMKNVIDGCQEHRSKLVFFSNVYPYGKVEGWMTEETPINPCSKKGEVRAKIEEMLWEEVKKGNLEAMIVRASDFYGPNTPLSYLKVLVFDNFAKGKTAQWVLTDKTKHSYSYTPDAGKATAIVGNTPSAYNQTWHAPTDRNTLTGKQFVEMAAEAFGVKPNYRVLGRPMLKMVGLFMPDVKEMVEMLYQNENDFLFDSSKFEKAFNIIPTSYQKGLQEVANSYR